MVAMPFASRINIIGLCQVASTYIKERQCGHDIVHHIHINDTRGCTFYARYRIARVDDDRNQADQVVAIHAGKGIINHCRPWKTTIVVGGRIADIGGQNGVVARRIQLPCTCRRNPGRCQK